MLECTNVPLCYMNVCVRVMYIAPSMIALICEVICLLLAVVRVTMLRLVVT